MRNPRNYAKHVVGLALVLAGVTSWLALRRGWSQPQPSALPPKLDQATSMRVSEAYTQLPMHFEANRGQTDSQVKFLARGSGYSLFLTATEAVLAWRKDEGRQVKDEKKTPASSLTPHPSPGGTLRMRLVGANSTPQVAGIDELPGQSHYFIGNDPQRWRTGVSNYARVQYHDVYPGVDLVYYGNQQQLEYDFILAPDANPNSIQLAFTGADQLAVDAQGDLVLRTAGGDIRQHKPIIYQNVNGTRQEIAGGYVRRGKHEVGFQVAAYDASRPLVIDPVLVYSTYLGGSGHDEARVAVDAAGNAYVTGRTTSANFPVVNPLQPAYGGGPNDVFVAKLNPTGSALIFVTYLGGSGDDQSGGIGVDASGNVYVAGITGSPNFPSANPLQPAIGGAVDAFVTKLNPAGNSLIYSTYLGGSGTDVANRLAVDAAGNAYVTGLTTSTNFPTVNPLQPTNGGGQDAFVAKVNAMGNALIYSTYLGGSGTESSAGIGVDAAGNAYVAGQTASPNFPTANPWQPAYGGGDRDVFVAKLNPTGSALVYSTYLGGSGNDVAQRVVADAAGNAYVTGLTSSTNFPTANPLQAAYGGGPNDAFVVKVNPTGSALVYSTYLGGSGEDRAFGIAADAAGNAYVSGLTSSADFPVVNPLQSAYGGGPNDAFVVKVNPTGSALVYSTYLGGSGDDQGLGIAVDAAGNAYVAGQTNSPNFPTVNPVQPAFGGGPFDAFIAKLSADAKSTAVATVSAASFSASAVASESIVSAFGSGLTTTTLAATSTPLPTSLGRISVKVKDGSGMERLAPLWFVSPTQINFQIPPGTTVGTATVTVTNNQATTAVGTVQVTGVAPGIFAANGNGQGVAAALALRVQPGNVQTYEPVAVFDAGQNQFVSRPLDLGPETDQVFLVLFGTGLRYRSSLATVLAKLGGVDGQVIYAGAQPDLMGLDQVNVRLPRSLIGRGEVEVALMVDGQSANTVRVNIR